MEYGKENNRKCFNSGSEWTLTNSENVSNCGLHITDVAVSNTNLWIAWLLGEWSLSIEEYWFAFDGLLSPILGRGKISCCPLQPDILRSWNEETKDCCWLLWVGDVRSFVPCHKRVNMLTKNASSWHSDLGPLHLNSQIYYVFRKIHRTTLANKMMTSTQLTLSEW